MKKNTSITPWEELLAFVTFWMPRYKWMTPGMRERRIRQLYRQGKFNRLHIATRNQIRRGNAVRVGPCYYGEIDIVS
jgi:hypothetical protein